jgi:hypothetical protein
VAVTLGTAITQVRYLVDETTAQFWTNAMLTSFLNQACEDIARQAQSLWMQYTFASIPKTHTHTTQPVANYPAPADLLGVHKMTFLIKTGGVSSQQYFNLEFRGIKQMDEIWGILHQLPAAYPNAFYLWNNPTIHTTKPPGTHWYLGIYPVPATTGTFTLYYYRKARKATGTTTPLDVTVGYEDVPFWYAVYMAKYRDRDPTWTTAKQMYDAMLLNMIDKTSRFTDEGTQFVDTSVAQWPVYLYSDTGGQW